MAYASKPFVDDFGTSLEHWPNQFGTLPEQHLSHNLPTTIAILPTTTTAVPSNHDNGDGPQPRRRQSTTEQQTPAPQPPHNQRTRLSTNQTDL